MAQVLLILLRIVGEDYAPNNHTLQFSYLNLENFPDRLETKLVVKGWTHFNALSSSVSGSLWQYFNSAAGDMCGSRTMTKTSMLDLKRDASEQMVDRNKRLIEWSESKTFEANPTRILGLPSAPICLGIFEDGGVG